MLCKIISYVVYSVHGLEIVAEILTKTHLFENVAYLLYKNVLPVLFFLHCMA